MSAAIPVYPDLAGKAVVTGSSRGLGAAVHHHLGAVGRQHATGGRAEVALQQTVEKIRAAGGEATAVTADVTQLDALERLREETERTYGPVEALGTFAEGGGHCPGRPPRSLRVSVMLSLGIRGAPGRWGGAACRRVGAVRPSGRRPVMMCAAPPQGARLLRCVSW